MDEKLIFRARYYKTYREPQAKEIFRKDFEADLLEHVNPYGNTVVQFCPDSARTAEVLRFLESCISFSEKFYVDTDIRRDLSGYVVTFCFDSNDFYKDEMLFLGPLLQKSDSCEILPAEDREAEDENFPPCTLRLGISTHRMLILGQE